MPCARNMDHIKTDVNINRSNSRTCVFSLKIIRRRSSPNRPNRHLRGPFAADS